MTREQHLSGSNEQNAAGMGDLTQEQLRACIRTRTLGQQLVCLEQTDSTNLRADELAKKGAAHGMLVTADMQSAGRGRRGRLWQQEPGTMIAMSLILRPTLPPDAAAMLTLVAAHSTALAIEKVTGVSAYIKWPNDIVLGGKKAVGILTEMCLEGGRIGHIILGIGINVGTGHFPAELADTATSLYLETGKRFRRCELAAEVLWQLEQEYEQFLTKGDLSAIRDDYNAHLVSRGKEVRILDPAGEYTAISGGITETGELMVEREDGRMERVYAGEVSVRGLYGYV